LDATANILISPAINISEKVFSDLIFAIIVGILIGIASILLILIIHRSKKGFFKESEGQKTEFGETLESL
jgi:hypothetical protein